ncbi:MAG: hypothetical protein LUG49_01310 [Oscillospiraceae bacterium]|nr:hypothetical protein [Oscillospiraceae bacterium]
MYCVKCGVELKDSEHVCPLCQTPVFHPDIKQEDVPRPYPEFKRVTRKSVRSAVMLIVTVCYILVGLMVTMIDFNISGSITWSGYVVEALLITYVSFALPEWFRHPNPVIFTPIAFATIILYLLYIDLMVQGGWFLSLAFPIAGIAGIIVTTVVTLLRYVKRGQLFIIGGALIATGGYVALIEMFISITFDSVSFVGWSGFPLAAFFILGMMLIVIGICKPLRLALSKIFFV